MRMSRPFGGNGGSPWDDRKHGGIRKIVIRCGVIIDSIRFVYGDDGGRSLEPPKHSGSIGEHLHTVSNIHNLSSLRSFTLLVCYWLTNYFLWYHLYLGVSYWIVSLHHWTGQTGSSKWVCNFSIQLYGSMGIHDVSLINSLTFQSNTREYDPYGGEVGTYFACLPNIGKIVGFYGGSGLYLNSTGAYFAPVFHLDLIETVGPYGGTEDIWVSERSLFLME